MRSSGEIHPEGEQSDEGSGGGDGYHSGRSSELVVSIVSAQVVTRLYMDVKCLLQVGLTSGPTKTNTPRSQSARSELISRVLRPPAKTGGAS